MEAARAAMWPALGALLVRDGAVTPDQLEEALLEKARSPRLRLGEILVTRGVVTRTKIAQILALQHELDYIELHDSEIEAEAVGLLPENLARRYRALPVEFLDDGSLLVAVADPTNVLFSDELRLALGVPVRVGVASQDAIESAINRHHTDEIHVEEIDDDDEHAGATRSRSRRRHADRGLRQQDDRPRARPRCVRHPLQPAAAPPLRPRARRRRRPRRHVDLDHARSRRSPAA